MTRRSGPRPAYRLRRWKPTDQARLVAGMACTGATLLSTTTIGLVAFAAHGPIAAAVGAGSNLAVTWVCSVALLRWMNRLHPQWSSTAHIRFGYPGATREQPAAQPRTIKTLAWAVSR